MDSSAVIGVPPAVSRGAAAALHDVSGAAVPTGDSPTSPTSPPAAALSPRTAPPKGEHP